jgi:ribonuclease-3
VTYPVSDLAALQARLGHTFRDPALLALALTHPSVTHDHGQGSSVAHNQRLEFLGDAVIQVILSRELYVRFPEVDEGPLTKTRAGLVNRRALAVQGRALGLGAYLRLSRGEETSGGRHRPSTLADAFEAVSGAIFLDGGIEAATRFVLACLTPELERADPASGIENPKGELQEMLQSESAHPPDYRVISATGPDHDRVFECTVHHGGRELARGVGKSKKTAEAEAALAALRVLRDERAATTLAGSDSGQPNA